MRTPRLPPALVVPLVILTAGLAGCELGSRGPGAVAPPAPQGALQGQPLTPRQATAQAAQAAQAPPAPAQPPVAQPALPAPAASAAPTPVPTPRPPPPHSLSIAAMRAREYPGSDLVVEQPHSPGTNYDQFIVSYRSDGLKIYALLTVPRGPRPPAGWPVVVFNHGFIPPAVYRTTERYFAYVDAFARNGYIVLRPDYRGHGSSEGAARGAYSTPDYVVDVLNALASIRTWPDADPERIGMWGHSMGGYITLRAMVTRPEIKAGVIWAGVVASYPDLLFRWGRPTAASLGVPPPSATPGRPLPWRDQLVVDHGRPDENPGFWASISANTYLADLSGPVQLHHGTADTSVPLFMSETLAQQIRAIGGPVELHVYPGDNHDIGGNLGLALARSVAFFDAHVKRR
jgi:alpha-beta hydrolase superfamily lysophospholipase